MIICIGNGESRKDYDLSNLNGHNTIGCNAIYRDYTPNILVAMDYKLCHEIYRSGYAFKNICYLKEWEKIKHTAYDKLFVKEHYKQFVGDVESLDGYVDEFSWPNTKKRFFVCWANNKDLMEDFKKEKSKEDPTLTDDDFKLHCDLDTVGYTITWTKKKDKVQSLKGFDTRTNAGALSMLIATQQPDVDKGIYLFGHDIYSNTKTVNNLYKGTDHYVSSENGKTPSENWKIQWGALFTEYKHIQFYKVNEKPVGTSDPINCVVDLWVNNKNVEYITYSTMLDKLK